MIGLLARTALVLLVGIVVGYAQNAIRPDGVSLARFEAPSVCAAPTTAVPSVERIVPSDAVASLERALVLDTRGAEAFAAGHVDGAKHLPCAASSTDADAIAALAQGHPIVIVYGDDPDAASTLAEEVARRAAGSTRFAVVEGTFRDLESAGAPAESGACDDCGQAP